MNNQSQDENGLLQFIATTVETMRGEMATKTDLAFLKEGMATHADTNRLEVRIEAESTAIRGDFERVDLRVGNIERMLSPRLD